MLTIGPVLLYHDDPCARYVTPVRAQNKIVFFVYLFIYIYIYIFIDNGKRIILEYCTRTYMYDDQFLLLLLLLLRSLSGSLRPKHTAVPRDSCDSTLPAPAQYSVQETLEYDRLQYHSRLPQDPTTQQLLSTGEEQVHASASTAGGWSCIVTAQYIINTLLLSYGNSNTILVRHYCIIYTSIV